MNLFVYNIIFIYYMKFKSVLIGAQVLTNMIYKCIVENLF